jgi:triphosphoribosyl-dephospho-CoA synthetase
LSFEDAILLAEHIEVPDAEVDDSWLSLDFIEEFYEETEEQRESIVNKILGDLSREDDDISGERVSMINRIMRMGMKDRVKLATKGDREARNILIRDPNRIVSQAVISNARITEQEVENIAAMRSAPEDVLRQIANNRNWSRNYSIMHNLARNPRTPMGNVITILTRLQMKDLNALSKNRNVSDAVRRQAFRLVSARAGR